MTDHPTHIGNLPWDEALLIYQAHHNGEPLELWIKGLEKWQGWNIEDPIYPNSAYRIVPRKPTVSQFLWDALPADVMAIAVDQSDAVYAYTISAPRIAGSRWINDQSGFINITHLRGHDFTGVDWKDSLVERPND